MLAQRPCSSHQPRGLLHFLNMMAYRLDKETARVLVPAVATAAVATAFVAANEMRNHVDRHGKMMVVFFSLPIVLRV